MTMTHFALQAPRVLGVAIAAFFTLFAFDVDTSLLPLPWAIAIVALGLVPSALVLGAVVLGWRWPLAGAIGFFALAMVYAYIAPQSRLDWIAAISGPLMIVGAAFLWSWSWRRQPPDGEEAETA